MVDQCSEVLIKKKKTTAKQSNESTESAKNKSANTAVRSLANVNVLAVFELLEYREFHVFGLFFDEAELGDVAGRVNVILIIT